MNSNSTHFRLAALLRTLPPVLICFINLLLISDVVAGMGCFDVSLFGKIVGRVALDLLFSKIESEVL